MKRWSEYSLSCVFNKRHIVRPQKYQFIFYLHRCHIYILCSGENRDSRLFPLNNSWVKHPPTAYRLSLSGLPPVCAITAIFPRWRSCGNMPSLAVAAFSERCPARVASYLWRRCLSFRQDWSISCRLAWTHCCFPLLDLDKSRNYFWKETWTKCALFLFCVDLFLSIYFPFAHSTRK